MVELDLEWDGLDKAFQELEAECTEVVRGIAIEAWNHMLDQTPQFWGRMAASWTFSYNAPLFLDRSETVDASETSDMALSNQVTYDTPDGPETSFAGLYKGHPEAIDTANFYNRGRDNGFQLGMTIFFANGVDHGEGPYSGAVESGAIRLRPVNRPGAPARRSLDFVAARYGRGVSAERAKLLKSFRIGGPV